MASATVTSLPLGAEIIPANDSTAGGAAPWEREGASHRNPNDPESRAKAEEWKKRAAEQGEGVSENPANIEEHKRRAERRKARKAKEKEAKRIEALEKNARRMYLLGFFALPLLWLVSLFYFHKDYKSADPNPVIKKYYKNSRFMLIIYTIAFTAWFVVFQVYSEDSLRSLNIIYVTGQSPSGI